MFKYIRGDTEVLIQEKTLIVIKYVPFKQWLSVRETDCLHSCGNVMNEVSVLTI